MSERLGEGAERLNPKDVVRTGSMFVIGRPDKAAIPANPRDRVNHIPIPPGPDGRPAYDRDLLWPEARARIKAAHEAKIRSNLLARDRLLTLCHNDPAARRDDQIICSRDVVYWIENWVWTVDPRDPKGGEMLPFVLYDRQVEMARFFADDFLTADSMSVYIEKSRAWGATWLFAAACAAWCFLYKPNQAILLGCANQGDVDDGGMSATHESIFGKIRFLLKRLPPWQIPAGLLSSVTNNKLFTLKHPENGNLLKGRQYCPNWARGPRFTFTISDEAAWSLNFHAASMSFGEASPRNWIQSTPHGMDNEYAIQTKRAREACDPEQVVKTLWWADNPNLGPDEYWALRKKKGYEKTAQERDIDYFGSISSAILHDFDESIHVVTERKEVRDADGTVLVEAREALDYNPDLPLGCAYDPGWDDAAAMLWIQPDRVNKTLNVVDFCQYEGRPALFLLPFLVGYIPELTLDGQPWPYEYDDDERKFISRHARWGPLDPSLCFGDRYGSSASTAATDGRTLYETLALYGAPNFYPVKVPPHGKEESVQRIISALGRTRIAGRLATQRTQSKENPTIVECFRSYSWAIRESPTGLPTRRSPRHDKFSHAMDAWAFYLTYEDGDDPKVMSGAPAPMRQADATGRTHFFRGVVRGSGEGEYATDPAPS